MKTTKDILNELRNLEPINFYNGLHINQIDIGSLFFEYKDKDLGKKSYQVFQVYLNNNITLNGANNILKQKSEYEKDLKYFYKELNNIYHEALIFNDFKFFITEIQRELKAREIIIQKEIKSLVNYKMNYLLKDFNNKINIDIFANLIGYKVIDQLEIENRVASELIDFTHKNNKNILALIKHFLNIEITKKQPNINKKN